MQPELEGITLEGKVIDLNIIPDKTKGMEIATERRKTLKEQIAAKRYRIKCKTKEDKYYEERKPSPCRRLTLDEIRKEYGMTRPYNTQVENMIYFIRKEGPVSSNKIAEYLGKTPKQISGPLSLLCKAVLEITTEPRIDGKGYLYKLVSQKSVADIYKSYNDGRKRLRKEKLRLIRNGGKQKKHPVFPSAHLREKAKQSFNELTTEAFIEKLAKVDKLVEQLDDVIGELQVKVDVTVRFGWLK